MYVLLVKNFFIYYCNIRKDNYFIKCINEMY